MTEKEIVHKYLGVKFSHMGRSIDDGLDCYGLIKCVYADIGIELIDLEEYARDWHLAGKDYFLENYYKQFVESPTHHPFDIVLLKNSSGVARHAGIVLTCDRFLHSCRSTGVVISKLSQRKWFDRIVGFYRILNHDISHILKEPV